MLTKVQTVQFGAVLKFLIEQITNKIINSNIELFYTIQQLTIQQRTGFWKSVGSGINVTANEAHDYYNNTWTLQFYQNYQDYREQLVELFHEQISYCKDAKDAIWQTVDQFQKKYPCNNCNERKLFQMLYRLASTKNKTPRKTNKSNQSPQYEVCEQFRFQNAVQQLNIIE
ncbi:Conserved_hypothetical protein [Hexamita inflata]|uniref:Uncharacterized protein n=1 Tax=Hexamita inflata TaxID=28002 RepID=A0AA86THJ8_9EUKA|nr:Conserved hypothetical protein [Hexamita inflata]